jgi:acetyl-CoA C-acetyltransferase
MNRQVAIIGVGWSGYHSISPDLSYKELMFEAATKAYADAGIDPRNDVDGFVTTAEDMHEGTSIFDEYVPDQLGAVQRPMHTITGDGLHGLAAAYMQIASDLMDIVVLEAHSKASNILTLSYITAFAMDPIFNRPLQAHPYFIAGMEMNRFMAETGTTPEECAYVSAKNKRNAMLNPLAAFPAHIGPGEVLLSEPVAEPLTRLQIAPHADGAIVFVLADGQTARDLSDTPVWIRGLGWCNDTPSLESRPWGYPAYAELAAEMAYRTAGIRSPRMEIDFAEIDDTFAFKELQHLEAIGLCDRGQAGVWTAAGGTELTGEFPVNPSGGCLGCGQLLDASGLARALEVVLQLRGQAGNRQLGSAETGLAFAWRGVPTTAGAAVILSSGR